MPSDRKLWEPEAGKTVTFKFTRKDEEDLLPWLRSKRLSEGEVSAFLRGLMRDQMLREQRRGLGAAVDPRALAAELSGEIVRRLGPGIWTDMLPAALIERVADQVADRILDRFVIQGAGVLPTAGPIAGAGASAPGGIGDGAGVPVQDLGALDDALDLFADDDEEEEEGDGTACGPGDADSLPGEAV